MSLIFFLRPAYPPIRSGAPAPSRRSKKVRRRVYRVKKEGLETKAEETSFRDTSIELFEEIQQRRKAVRRRKARKVFAMWQLLEDDE